MSSELTSNARDAGWLRGGRAVAGVFAGSLILGLFGVWHRLGGAGEQLGLAAALISGALLALRSASGRSARAGRRGGTFAPVWLALFILGQFAEPRVSFPFIPFRMFSEALPWPFVFHAYRAHHRSGRVRPFHPASVLGTLGYSRIVTGLDARLTVLDELRHEPKLAGALAHGEAHTRSVLRALIALYNRDHPQDPIVSIDALRGEWSKSTSPDAIAREIVLSEGP